jgi:hypothetical protein
MYDFSLNKEIRHFAYEKELMLNNFYNNVNKDHILKLLFDVFEQYARAVRFLPGPNVQ